VPPSTQAIFLTDPPYSSQRLRSRESHREKREAVAIHIEAGICVAVRGSKSGLLKSQETCFRRLSNDLTDVALDHREFLRHVDCKGVFRGVLAAILTASRICESDKILILNEAERRDPSGDPVGKPATRLKEGVKIASIHRLNSVAAKLSARLSATALGLVCQDARLHFASLPADDVSSAMVSCAEIGRDCWMSNRQELERKLAVLEKEIAGLSDFANLVGGSALSLAPIRKRSWNP
jgi:hypothetical protein